MKNIKISLNIGETLLQQIDDTSEKMCMTRTNIILLALNQYFEQRKALDFMQSKEMQDMIKILNSADKLNP